MYATNLLHLTFSAKSEPNWKIFLYDHLKLQEQRAPL